MQTLVFNTTTKSVKLYESQSENSSILFTADNVPTVKMIDGYYEVMQIIQTESTEARVPIARFPIAATNMLIKK